MDLMTRHINILHFFQVRNAKESRRIAWLEHERLRKVYLKIQQDILLKKELAIKRETELRELEASNEKKLFVI